MGRSKKLILHIGRSKSGTSTLQHYLTDHRKELASQGVCYPKTGRGRRVAQHGIAQACRSLVPFGHDLREMRRAFESEIAPFDQVIVSSEGFQQVLFSYNLYYFFGRPDATSRKNFLQRSFHSQSVRPYDVSVICYLREYLEFASSSYAQNVQNSNQHLSLAKYCAKHFRRPLSSLALFWQRFSDEAVFLYYDRNKLLNQDIVQDFFQHVALTPPSPSTYHDANPTISGNLLAFKLLLNRKKRHSPSLYRVFSELARLEPRYRGRLFLSDAHAEELRSRDRGYNATLREFVGQVEERSFENGNPFDPVMWSLDLERFLDHPGLADLKDQPEIYRASENDVKALLVR